MIKCQGENCTYEKAWAFRDVGFWSGKSKNLCDECWGHRYGDEVCGVCEEGCYEEDYDEKLDKYICGSCLRKEDVHA